MGALNQNPSHSQHACWVPGLRGGPPCLLQMLPRDEFATFCCNYCDGFLNSLTLHNAKWQASCPASKTQRWVMFHVACTGENRGYTGEHDEVL